MSRKIVLVALIIVMLPTILAFGITPGKTTFDYEPGIKKVVQFTVVNSEKKDMNLVVLIQGELNQSIAVSEVSFKMSATENSKTLSYTLTMPPALSPGLHTGEVVVLQLPEKSPVSQAFVGATVGVATQIHVYVPYPGKYAEADLSVVGPDEEGKVMFVIPVVSRGELDLVRVRATIDIYTSLNEKVATVSTNEVSILSQERKEIVATWDSSDAKPGPYRAVATILYDEETLTIEKNFNIGKKRLNIVGIEVNDFTLGEIAKFEILVENKWSEAIKGVYAQMHVFNKEGDIMADFKSPTYDIEPLTKTLMIAFWDTAGVKKGIYDSSLFLRYGQSSEQQDLKLEVKENEINIIGIGYIISKDKGRIAKGGGGLNNVLIVAIIVLVLVNLSWFLFIRRKLRKK